MFCEKCGTQILPGEKFCRSCGNPVSNSNVSSQQKKTKKQKKPINKKKLIPIIIGVIAFIAVITVGAFALNSYIKEAPSREMEKALESKDINQVLDVIKKYEDEEEYSNKVSQLRKTIVKNINDATSLFNNEFEYDKELIEEGDIQQSIIEFMETRFGSLFYVNGAKSEIWDLNPYFKSYDLRTSFGEESNGTILIESRENIYGALGKLDKIIASKMAYYYGLDFLKNPEDSEDYCNAIEKFNDVIADDTKYNDAIAKSGEAFEAYFSEILKSADKYIADGDYASAMEILDDALEKISESEKYSEAIVTKTDEIRKKYASQYAQKAEEYFKAGDVNAAIGSIEAAISIDPEGGYDVKLIEYKMYLPLALYDKNNILREEDGTGYGSYSVYNGATSNDNQDFANVIVVNVANTQSTPLDMKRVHYNLAGKYDTVDGTIFVKDYSKSDVFSGYFEAYGDGKLLFTSPKMTAGVLPQKFSFSVSGVQDLEIRYCGAWVEDHFFNPSYCIANFEARKNLPQ